MSFSANEGTRSSTLEQKLISGYDGFGGVHDNILWNVTAGFTYFTLNNKLIMENTKTRKQHIFHEPLVQLSCMAGSVNEKYIAVSRYTATTERGSHGPVFYGNWGTIFFV